MLIYVDLSWKVPILVKIIPAAAPREDAFVEY